MSNLTPTFTGEMQLAGWSESHNGGCKVVFWLPSSEDLDAFRALTVRKGNQSGHRFMAALVEVGDDELPVQPAPQTEQPKGGALAVLAGRLCQDPEFWQFLSAKKPRAEPIASADAAAQAIRDICNVDSRAELDHIKEAAEAFHAEIRLPYVRWRQGVRG